MVQCLSKKLKASAALVLHLLQIYHTYLQARGAGCCQTDITAQNLLPEMGASMLDSSHRALEPAALQYSCKLPKEQAPL